jgi:outer membrane protein OmpA-like peptidoglycan-associated protein/opacity protein-like surface antigen
MKLTVKMIATAALAALLIPGIAALAQSQSPYAVVPHFGTPKVELFVGYSYVRAVPEYEAGNRLVDLHGGSASFAYNFNRYLGIVADVGGYDDSKVQLAGRRPYVVADSTGTVYSYLIGPRVSFRGNRRLTPFAQALFGEVRASDVTISSSCRGVGCTVLPEESKFGFTAGGGLDYRLRHHLSLRLIQGEYLMTNFEDHTTGKSASQNDMRLSSGIVFRFGGNPAPPPSLNLACAANPASVFPGDPVTVTAAAGNLDPKLNAVYSFTGSGATASGSSASVATAALAPGPYTVNCGVKEGKAGNEGLKPWESATATANFAVKAFEPPTISCAVSPNDIKPGDTSTVTAAAVSPQNRPLTYSYTSSTGSITGSGTTAAFSSGDALAGVVTVSCNVTDDKNQTATATASLTITVPYVAPVVNPEILQLESRLALHSVFFQTDVPRIAKPDAGLLVSQEATLTTLAADFTRYLTYKPDAQLTLTGHADVRGSVEYNKALSERRVVRAKQFLVQQGVPEDKIETADLGKEDNLTADQVKTLIEQNPELDQAHREKALNEIEIIKWAQNRRVDITLKNAGDKTEHSVRLYPFNAADAVTLLDEKNLKPSKPAVHSRKK